MTERQKVDAEGHMTSIITSSEEKISKDSLSKIRNQLPETSAHGCEVIENSASEPARELTKIFREVNQEVHHDLQDQEIPKVKLQDLIW